MPVTKRVRFEVLRRDNHTCHYCGARAPEVAITIDHVVPVALGGSDNSGKSSATPDQALVAQVDEDAARWARARARAIQRLVDEKQKNSQFHQDFKVEWESWDSEGHFLPRDWKTSLDTWIADGITEGQILEAHEIAVDRRHLRSNQVFRYMAGIIRNWIKEIDEATRLEMEEGA